MSQFKVYQDYSSDATLVSNVFIDHYMQNANDAQIKIYLYLLRILSAHQNCSISDLADQFNYTEKDVTRALKYWEKNGLLALDFDDSKTLVGVRFLDVVEKENTLSLAPVVQLPIAKPMPQATMKESGSSVIRTEETRVEETQDAPKYVKPHYTTEDILSFKSNAAISELLFVVEQYLGKTLSPSDIKSVLFISDELGFSNELIDYLFEYCVGRGKKDFRYIEKVAMNWKDEGITTPKMAAKAAKKYDKTVYSVMNALGKQSAPTSKEADFIIRWTETFGFEFDIVEEACNRTVMATDSHRFEYADSILTSWHRAGVHHKSDIDTLDAEHERKKKTSGTSGSDSAASFKRFEQRKYDFDKLEKEIISN